MKKVMHTISITAVLLMGFSIVFYYFLELPVAKPFAITFGTTAYHFLMRLVVGGAFDRFMNNRADYSRKWYQCRAWEDRVYKWLRVKQWKRKMPSYHADLFNPKLHSWNEIAQAMCQAELVHEVIVILSFVPILFSCWFSELFVFMITSVCAAMFDMLFVLMQRCNRQRVVKLINR